MLERPVWAEVSGPLGYLRFAPHTRPWFAAWLIPKFSPGRPPQRSRLVLPLNWFARDWTSDSMYNSSIRQRNWSKYLFHPSIFRLFFSYASQFFGYFTQFFSYPPQFFSYFTQFSSMPLNFFGNQDRASIQRGRKSPSSSPTTDQQFNVEEKS